MVYQNEQEVQKAITEAVKATPVLLFVKGSRNAPMCGFSKGVMDVFDSLGVDYSTVDVLSDPLIRDGIKKFTSWPTIPQIFIGGEFVGGFDIVRDLYSKGELQTLLKEVASKQTESAPTP